MNSMQRLRMGLLLTNIKLGNLTVDAWKGGKSDPNPDNWFKMNGTPVHKDEHGDIDGGVGGKFNGQKVHGSKKKNTKSKENKNIIKRGTNSKTKKWEPQNFKNQGTKGSNTARKEGKNTSSEKITSKSEILHGRTESYNKAVQKAFEKVVEHGNKTGKETMVMLYRNGNEAFPGINGSEDTIVFDKSTIIKLSLAEDESITFIHNHPRSSSFSDSDLDLASRFRAFECMRVKGHDGTEYYLSVGQVAERPTRKEIKNLYEVERKRLFDKYNSLVKSGKLTPDEAWKEHSHEIVEAVAKKLGWTYERRLPK